MQFKMRNLQAHDKSTNTLQHQSSFHTHIEILHICTVCPAFLALSENEQTNRQKIVNIRVVYSYNNCY